MGPMTRWLLVLGLTGCSFTMTGPDPNRPKSKAPTCDSSKAPVVVDGVLAAASGITALAIVSGNNGAAAIAPALFGALFIGGALHGNTIADKCQAANDEYASYLSKQRPPIDITAKTPYDDDDEPAVAAKRPLRAPPAVAAEAHTEVTTLKAPTQPAQPAQQPPPPPKHDWIDFWKEVP